MLEHISLCFSLYPLNEQLYEELFMFIMAIQSVNENESVKKDWQMLMPEKAEDEIYKRLTELYQKSFFWVSAQT